MTIQVATHYPQGINLYVPAMQYSADLISGQPSAFSLGTPAVGNTTTLDTDIDADAVAGTETQQAWTADSPFGRTLTMDMDADPGAALGIYDVYGTDYLGQQMIERFTHVNGSTPIIYGLKAFYRVTKVAVVTAATNDTTVNLGTGNRLGLPFKGDVVWAKESNVFVEVFNREVTVWTNLDAAAVVAGASAFIRSPFPGYVKTLRGIPGGNGSTTNAATTAELGGNAITGLSITMDQDTTTEVTDTPTTAGYDANNRFAAGGLIELVHAATTSGDTCQFGLDLVPSQFSVPDITDAATVNTGDPRGTYESLSTLDDALEIIVGMNGDSAINAAGNGGLHGILHYFA